jgi:hypothetical protein
MFDRTFDPDQSERKFLLDARDALEVWGSVCKYLGSQQDSDQPALYVRTTYFDTPDFAYYRSARGAVAHRLRLREYATASRRDAAPVPSRDCYLELKQSAGGLRAKTRLRVRPDDVQEKLRQLSDAPLSACVGSLYRRAARTSRDGRLRVTLDDCILFCQPSSPGSPFEVDGATAIAAGPPFVLEVKRGDASPHWLTSVLSRLPEAAEFSKFEAGMRAAAASGLLARAPMHEVAL